MNGLDWIVRICLALLFFVITAAYLSLVERSNRRLTKWPLYKSFCWFGGWLTAAYSVYGVLFEQPNFIEHMIHHLVLGMLSPLLIVLSSPITLLLRSLSVAYVRRITKILKSHLSVCIIIRLSLLCSISVDCGCFIELIYITGCTNISFFLLSFMFIFLWQVIFLPHQ